MKVLQIGLPKSGNYWLYEIVHNIFQYCNIEKKSFIENQAIFNEAKDWQLSTHNQARVDVIDVEKSGYFYRISTIHKERIADLNSYLSASSHVWTHSHFCSNSKNLINGFDKAIYIVRDPRDAAISLSKFMFTPYMMKYAETPTKADSPETHLENHLNGNISNWVEHVGRYLKVKNELNIHFVFYERLLDSFTEELSSLLEYLELSMSDEQKLRLKEQVSFKSMKSKGANHMRTGSSKQWATKLSKRQQIAAQRISRPLLDTLNYPASADDCLGCKLPSVSTVPSNSAIDAAILRGKIMKTFP